MKETFYSKADVAGRSPVFWILAAVILFLAAVFFIRQASYMPVDGDTLKAFMVDEGRGKSSSYKKYFPKPYSVTDLGDQ
ncbi:MAG: hypothetical protein LBR90_02310 [Elusimicrobiota bacterium]|jgi:hypothetical protein|nr:hypothetical protein [Elusimicrobiota bacterium]